MDRFDELIEKAQERHSGGMDDYSRIREPCAVPGHVNIICKKHGLYTQTPRSHLDGHRCRSCTQNHRPVTMENFLERARAKFEDKYDYSHVELSGTKKKVEIVCPIDGHGPFQQTPHAHLRGNGCPSCALITRSRALAGGETFVEKARARHGDKYDYSDCEYVNNRTKVVIICPQNGHGRFEQTPMSHLNSVVGCSKCAQVEKGAKCSRAAKRKRGEFENEDK